MHNTRSNEINMSEGTELAHTVLAIMNEKATKNGDGVYYPRTSGISRCPRDMVMHRFGEPWSNPPQDLHGQQLRFDQGHDTEDRVLAALREANIGVGCEQMTVVAETAMGLKVKGHIDGIVCIPDEYALGGKWYLLDVKSAGTNVYKKVYDEEFSKPKQEHIMQISIYAESFVDDKKFPHLKGVKVSDIEFEGYEFGGGLVAYMSIDRVTKGRGAKKVELPKLHFCEFDVDPMDVEVYLDAFDEPEIHYENKTIPPIPYKNDAVVWNGARCTPRWCARFDVCQGNVDPESKELMEVMHGV